jgi:hypothetical protein
MEVCCDPLNLLRDPRYKEAYENCEAPPHLTAAFRRVAEPKTLLVVLGFWCPDSLRLVPCTLKAVAEAENDNLQVLGISVPLEETDPMPIRVGPFEIHKFPTFIVLVGHHEKLASVSAHDEIVRFAEQAIEPALL